MTTIDMRVRNIITMLAPDNRMEPVFPSETLEGLGFDSLDRFEMTAKIEEEFSIEIEDGVPEAWTTVQDVIDSVLNEVDPMLTPEQYEKERTFVPHPGDYVNVTMSSNGKIDVKPATPPVINRIERADVKTFAAGLRDHEIMGEANAIDYYQRIATKSAIYPGKGTPFDLMYAALGLAEAGEVQNKVKKAFRDDHIIPLLEESGGFGHATAKYEIRKLTDERRAQIIKELGGAMWYVAAVCDEIGATMSEVALQNLDELCVRGERDTLRGDGDNR